MVVANVLIERAEVVRIHLDVLNALLGEAPNASQAIRASISLRFLFDGALQQVAHEKGVDLNIPMPDLDGIPLEHALFFSCGGYSVGGYKITPFYAYREPGKHSPHRAQFERQMAASPKTHRLIDAKLRKFTQQPCISIVGKPFTREALVRYVANKCGGAHHHEDTKKFNELEHAITAAGQSLESPDLNLSAVFIETVGTASYLLNAPAIQHLLAELSRP